MRVFIKTDSQDRITAVNSEIFISDLSGWTEIDSGDGDRFVHAQGNSPPKSVIDDNGIYRYKFENGAICERSEEEMAADMPIPEPEPPTNAELAQAIAELAEVICGG